MQTAICTFDIDVEGESKTTFVVKEKILANLVMLTKGQSCPWPCKDLQDSTTKHPAFLQILCKPQYRSLSQQELQVKSKEG